MDAPEAPQGPPARLSLGPAWLAGEQAWEGALPELMRWPQPLGLLGEAGLLKSFRTRLGSAWLEGGLHIELLALPDGSDCCEASLTAARALAKGKGVRSLIGLGGGRMLDLAKLLAAGEGWRLATAPTSAATCACATGVAVLNDGQGGFVSVQDLDAPPALCLVDVGALRAAPPRLLAAGLADTLAKWLEWRALEAAPEGPSTGSGQDFGSGAGWELARRAAMVCEGCGDEALSGQGASAFEQALEACLLLSAAASGAGQAPAAAAHSLANALSRQPQGKALLHGEAVGLGLLWQEALLRAKGSENMRDASREGSLARRLKGWGLPTALPAGLDIRALLQDAMAPGETVHLLGTDLDAEKALAPLLSGC